MAQFEHWFDQDFTEKIEIRHCESVMFTGDDKGAVVGVHLFNNGTPYSGGGTVSGKVIRSDGAEVALTGTISGNAVSVVLLESCLAVPGPIGVYVRLTANSQKTTVLSAIYTVQATSTGTIVDPGTIISSVNDLIDDIQEAVASIPSDYSDLLAAIAPTFSSSAVYAVGTYVWYDGDLYRFITAHPAGSWNASHAVQAVFADEIFGIKSVLSTMSNPLSGSRTGSGQVLYDNYPLYAGEVYVFTVTGANSINFYERDNGVTGANIFTVSAGETKTYIPTANHTGLRAYFNGSSSFRVDTGRIASLEVGKAPIGTVNEISAKLDDLYYAKSGTALSGGTASISIQINSGDQYTVTAQTEQGTPALIGKISIYNNNTEASVVRNPDTDDTRVYTFVAQSSGNQIRIHVDRACIITITNDNTKITELQKEIDSVVAYVSKDGSDDNFGTSNDPFATVTKALKSGFKIVCVGPGRYAERIMIPDSATEITIISNRAHARVIFTPVDCVIGSSETKTNGYNNVYQMPFSGEIAEENNWIYQDDVPDASTLISDAERHPLERGYAYRCEDTKIVRCNSDTLSAALTEIDAASNYRWFLDNGVIYYSRPQSVSADHPICYSNGARLFGGVPIHDKRVSIKIVGIETKYAMFNIENVGTAEVLDCKAANVYGDGAFKYDRAKSAVFVRCEAVRAQKAETLGDGFNGHSYESGDTFSKQTDVTMIDCYSHDNNDDGYSDHERSEITIIGGLFEYNGKAGVTPSYGSHCTCLAVYSRYNYAGFYYTGAASAAEGGKYGQMICNGCVAEGNTRGGKKAGYIVDGGGNTAILINCKSIGNKYGYYLGGSTNMATLMDCGSLNDETVKVSNNGTFTIKNTSIVS